MQELNVFGLIDAARLMERRITVALFYSGLRINQYRAMKYIETHNGITVTGLSKYFRTTRATASALANELIKLDVLVAIENRDDRRSFFLKLTQSGKNKLKVGQRDIEFVMDSISEEFEIETIEQINKIVEIGQS